MSTQANAIAAPDARRWKALFLLCLAQFMVIMDTSIIGVALPAIKEALGYSQDSLQWIFNAYVIFLGASCSLADAYLICLASKECSCWDFSFFPWLLCWPVLPGRRQR
ncbi:hypothetical protein N6H14_32515 [Paenibacillus sp. CC-CFT747]|nr:hypothetical protein N6H14_32515 [Paenibacillus sp. CC-CFT747]